MLRKIKSLFVVEEEGTDKTNQTTSQDDMPSTSKEPFTESRTQEYLSEARPVTGAPDPKFVDVLLKAIESANKDGFDYLEYKTSLQSLQKMDMDEATRFKSAYAMAKTLGLNKSNLLQSTDHYIAILNNEEKKFKDALINQKARQVEGREVALKNIEKAISEKQAAIERLKAEIEASNAELVKVREEITDAIQKIDSTNDQFMHAFRSVMGQITEDRSKIETYID